MLLSALNLLVGLIVVALGANVIWTRDNTAPESHEVLRTRSSWVPVRSWSQRFGGAFLIVIGLSTFIHPLF